MVWKKKMLCPFKNVKILRIVTFIWFNELLNVVVPTLMRHRITHVNLQQASILKLKKKLYVFNT